MLFIAGDHEPVIVFVLVVGNAEIDSPEQYGPTALNVGFVFGVIVIVFVVVKAHCPVVGVNVYAVVAVLLIVGDQVPVILLLDVVGKEEIDSPEQYEPPESNVGLIFGLITTSVVTGSLVLPPTVITRLYVPSLALVTLEIVGFIVVDVQEFGPLQL